MNVEKTKTMVDVKNKTWKPKMDIPMQKLCALQSHRKIKFTAIIKDKEICEGITTIDLCNDSKDPKNPEVDLFKIKDGKRTNIWAGTLRLQDFTIIDHENFAAYLQAGLKMSLSMAIDFSASNGQVWDSAIGMWKFKKLKKKDFNMKKVPWIERAESGFDPELGMTTTWKYDKTFGASAHTTE